MKTDKYDDIINTKWDENSLSNRMNINQRAKIFLPFAALTGFEEELDKALAKIVAKENKKKLPDL